MPRASLTVEGCHVFKAKGSCTTRAHRVARSWTRILERRHCEERSDEAIHCHFCCGCGLLRSARNDGTLKRSRHTLKPSSPAKAGDPVFRGVSDVTEKPRRTGYPACAGDDDLSKMHHAKYKL